MGQGAIIVQIMAAPIKVVTGRRKDSLPHRVKIIVPLTLCERKARLFKRRQHASIAFRSFGNLGHVCEGIAAVDNMRTAGKDVFAETRAVFDRPRRAAATSS